MGNRKAFIAVVVEQFSILPDPMDNKGMVKKWLEGLTNPEFEKLVTDLENGATYLSFIIDNFSIKWTIGQLKAAALQVGAPVYSKVIEEDKVTGLTRLSNETHWIALMPKRRQIQDVDDKRSMASDSNTRDVLTGQVTGDSKGSAIASGQLSAIISRGCAATAVEFARMRGGDITAGAVFNKQLMDGGSVSVEAVSKINSRPTVNETFSSYLNTIHIANNVAK